MLKRFLTEGMEQLIRDERRQLIELKLLLQGIDADEADSKALDRALAQLDELFLLVVVGEFNSGKSAFINALLGHPLLEEGVTPTTTRVHLIRYGAQIGKAEVEPDIVLVSYPLDWLRDVNLVDTPGTNAVIQRHQVITEDFVPRADLVLFVTSADRPFSESERLFLERIRQWGKKIVVVINKIDLLGSNEDLARVRAFVEENAQQLLGARPMVFPVSSRFARMAKEQPEGELRTHQWEASRFEPLQTYILVTLDERERLRLKLSSPLGIAQRLAARYQVILQQRKQLLSADVATIGTIQSDLAQYESDMRRDYKYRLSYVDGALFALSERGERFIDDTIRIGRIFDLMNGDRIRAMFEREVVANTAAEAEQHTQDMIDWMVESDLRQWQSVMGYLNRRLAQREGDLVGTVHSEFELNRKTLLDSVGRTARETVAGYDRNLEARSLTEAVQTALAQTAMVEMGAIGLGAILVKVLATTLADVSGIAAAGALAAMGFYILPRRRQLARRDLVNKVGKLRAQLDGAMGTEFERELDRSVARLRAAIAPYTRFVKTQQEALEGQLASLAGLSGQLAALAQRVDLPAGADSGQSGAGAGEVGQ